MCRLETYTLLLNYFISHSQSKRVFQIWLSHTGSFITLKYLAWYLKADKINDKGFSVKAFFGSFNNFSLLFHQNNRNCLRSEMFLRCHKNKCNCNMNRRCDCIRIAFNILRGNSIARCARDCNPAVRLKWTRNLFIKITNLFLSFLFPLTLQFHTVLRLLYDGWKYQQIWSCLSKRELTNATQTKFSFCVITIPSTYKMELGDIIWPLQKISF